MSDQNKRLFYIVSGITIIIVLLLIVGLTLFKNNGGKDFIITSTTPKDAEQNIKPEEILITFTTDKPVASKDDYTISVSPPVNYQLKALSTFPTQTVTTQALGGLATNTTYTITVTNNHTKQQTSWSFTTSGKIPESSSEAFSEVQKQTIDEFYPFIEKTPYESDKFTIVAYTDRLTLLVKIKTPDVEAAKKEVVEWIRSNGVDPSTHTINYENAF